MLFCGTANVQKNFNCANISLNIYFCAVTVLPKTNCWEFISEREADFEILYIIFESKILQSFIRGSVIPFIALIDYKNIITPILQKAIHENRIINEHYLQLRKIEQQTANQEKIIKLLQEMKITVSRQAYKNITAQ